MKLQMTPIALGAIALLSAAPFAAQAAPTVSWRAPSSGATITQDISNSSACEVTGTNIGRVVFQIRRNGTTSWSSLNTETSAPWRCNIDIDRYTSGSYRLRARAYDSAGAQAAATRDINISRTTSGTTTNPGPVVTFSAPADNATIGTRINQSSACQVSATDANGIQNVRFYLDATLLNTETGAPYQCTIDPRNHTNGAHTLRAVATDRAGASTTAQIAVNITNGIATTPTTPTTPTEPVNTAPTVSLTAPAADATLSGTSAAYAANAADTNTGGSITRVDFFLQNSAGARTLVGSRTASPYSGTFNTTSHVNGTYQLVAVATDNGNLTATTLRSVTISNTVAGDSPPPTATTTPVWTAPASGATISQDVIDSSACEVAAANVQRVVFQIRRSGTTSWTNFTTDFAAPWRCNIDVDRYTAGAYQLRAVAYDMSNVARTAMRDINIGTATSGGDAANTAPTVTLTAPIANATLSGTSAGYAASAADTNTGGTITRVDFFLQNSAGARTLVGSRTSSPYSGSFNTTSYANGTYQLVAVATDNGNLTASAQRAVTVSNTVTPPAEEPTTPPTGGLPSTGTRAVATYESLGLYWTPGTNPGAAGCQVRYRKSNESTWKDGLAMWYDSRNSECRGSLVHLTSGTEYVVQFSLPNQQPSRELTASTWSDSKPIAQTVYVTSGDTQINITQGGTANGYVLYTPAPGTQAVRDVAGNADYNIAISAPYVIVRGLTLRNARIDGIRLLPGARDVIIEDNDISGWGRFRATVGGEQVGMDRDSAVRADCRNNAFLERITVQRNRMHDPRYTTNSWDNGHPLGPQAVTYSFCPGNHVIRYNDVYSATGTKYLNDGFSGEDNFSNVGFPNHDSDIYGNKISHVWDDAIEAEGANRNVRIWNNYMDKTGTGVATSTTATGPVYIFRNVYNRSQKLKGDANGTDRLVYLKSGSHSTYGNGRRYVFHNTMLQATAPGLSYTLGAGGGLHGSSSTQPLTNTVSRNNILHVWRSGWNSINTVGGGGNDLDYDLRNGGTQAYAGAESNGIIGVPTYAAGHGWQSESGGNYQLAPGTPGYDRGARIPNFNDGFTGSAPDFGAHEGGTPAMRFGIGD